MNARTLFLCAAATAAAVAAPASAQLRITETFGGISGSDPTVDWFEITNFGAATVDTLSIFYDDESADPEVNDQVFGLNGIAPGESVIVVIEDGQTAADDLRAFFGLSSSVQVGWIDDGAGLGQDDTVNLFDSNLAGANVLASQFGTNSTSPATLVYNPDTDAFGDLAQDGVFGAFVTPFDQAGTNVDIIASPGVIPSPGAMALVALGGLVAGRRRRA